MKRSNAICKRNGRENAGVVGIFTGWMLAFQLADRRATFFFRYEIKMESWHKK